MKYLFVALLTVIGFDSHISQAGTNLSDAIDKNKIPAEQEQREEEVVNLPDPLDKNATPATLESRKKDEVWRDDYQKLQNDMPKQNKVQK